MSAVERAEVYAKVTVGDRGRIIIVVRGRTFPMKDRLKAAGFKWGHYYLWRAWVFETEFDYETAPRPIDRVVVFYRAVLEKAGIKHVFAPSRKVAALLADAGFVPVRHGGRIWRMAEEGA